MLIVNQQNESQEVRLARIRVEQQRQTRQRELLAAERIRNMDPVLFQAINDAIERSGEAYWQQGNR